MHPDHQRQGRLLAHELDRFLDPSVLRLERRGIFVVGDDFIHAAGKQAPDLSTWMSRQERIDGPKRAFDAEGCPVEIGARARSFNHWVLGRLRLS